MGKREKLKVLAKRIKLTKILQEFKIKKNNRGPVTALKRLKSGHGISCKGGEVMDISKYPKPDRSYFKPNLTVVNKDQQLDIGWAEGVFSDGRSYRAELWRWEHNSILTVFFSTIGLENASVQELSDLLEKELLLKFKGGEKGKKSVMPSKVRDSSENEMWEVSILVGFDEEILVTGGPRFKYHGKD